MMNNEKGVTLIELIVSLAIFSIIISVTLSILLFGSRTFKKQTETTNDLINIRHAIDYLTKEIRKSDSINITDDVLTLNNQDVYKLENNKIMKNNSPIIYNIDLLRMTKSGSKIELSIKGMKGKEIHSILYIR